LEQLIDRHEERRAYAAAIAYAQRLLRHDPLHEAAYLTLMRLYAVSGDRPAALRIYHSCVTVLERELGVPPSGATQQIYEQLLAVDSGVGSTPLVPADSPFTGRHRQRQALQQWWRAGAQGSVQCVCLSGDAGIGKTRLADEFAN
jgi:DNA-binding SARP family transcriptional activator